MAIKILLGGLITGIVTFLLCWLFFGVLLADFYTNNATSYPGLIKKMPEVWFIATANFAWGLLLSWIYNKAGIDTMNKGLIAGLIISFLNITGFDLFLHAQMNLYNEALIAVDIAVNTVMGGIGGAVLGWWMGRMRAVSL